MFVALVPIIVIEWVGCVRAKMLERRKHVS
jgi:hypothetical protein